VNVPGLTVVFPSHRHDVAAALRNAVLCWPNPTVFFEHKLLYGEQAASEGFAALPPEADDPGSDLFPTVVYGTADADLTIVTYGGMLPHIESLAAELGKEEIQMEIVVPSLLAPMPRGQLCRHLLSRERVLVVEEAAAEAGFGAQLGAELLQRGYSGRFRRVATPCVPIPAARSLEAKVIPGRAEMTAAVLELLLA
jgi:2-oxoisovalerate dehydrogenase E1 component